MPSTPPQSRHRGCRGAHRRDPGGLFLRRRRNAVAVGGTFQFHSPGGQTEIIYAEEERAPLPDFSDPSLMEEGLRVYLSPVMDLFDRSIVAHTVATSPTTALTAESLAQAIKTCAPEPG